MFSSDQPDQGRRRHHAGRLDVEQREQRGRDRDRADPAQAGRQAAEQEAAVGELLAHRGDDDQREHDAEQGRAAAEEVGGQLFDRGPALGQFDHRPRGLEPDPARYRPNDQPLILGDPTKIREELGWTPTIPFEQTLDDLLEFWRAVAHQA